jgi:hypothetical protein
MWIMSLHHGKRMYGFERKRKHPFCDFWHNSDDFAKKMLQTSFPNLKKHHPTRLYMIYLMMQSIWLVCVEKVKKMPSQWHCPSSLENLHPSSEASLF